MSTLARSTDPYSSHTAAADVASFVTIHFTAILKLLAKYPSSTSAELATYSQFNEYPLDQVQISRRMKQLETRGQIQRDVIRTCRVGKRIATAWSLVAK